MDKTKNKGFTLVEIIVVFIVIAILAAIIIPIAFSIMDDSSETDNKLYAKTIMNAVQTEFNNLASNNEVWYSVKGEMGIPLNKDRKNYGQTQYANQNEFKNGFINIGDTVPGKSILDKIEKSDEIYALYIGAGNTFEYFMSDQKYEMYKIYIVIYQLKDEKQKVYFYDGKEVTTEWPFSSPNKNNTSQNGQAFYLKNNPDIKIQLYALKIGKKNTGCDAYWNNYIMKKVNE